MNLEILDNKGIESTKGSSYSKLESFHKDFEKNAIFNKGTDTSVNGIRINDCNNSKVTALKNIKNIYNGILNSDGTNTLGLKEIHSWKINEDYYKQNLKQHAGFAAEVISTLNDNNNGIEAHRVDDLSEASCKSLGFSKKNDQYVDRIKVERNADGTIKNIEKIQTKFVGNNAKECFSKLKSKKYEKYLENGKVDKLEIPKNYFDDVKSLISEENSKLKNQLAKVTEQGKNEEINKIQKRIEVNKKLDNMIEKSSVTTTEAEEAVLNPRKYLIKQSAKEINKSGLESAKSATILTAAISTGENVNAYRKGEVTAVKMVENIGQDTAEAGAIGYISGISTEALSGFMSNSGSEIIKKAGSSNVPGMVVAYGVTSAKDIKDFANGKIDGAEFTYNMGENAAEVIGGTIGATVGSIGGPIGSFAGGAVGSQVGVEVYDTTVDFVIEHIDDVIDAADEVKDVAADVASDMKDTASGALKNVKGQAMKVFKKL